MRRSVDKVFLWTVIFLTLFGFFILFSASFGALVKEGGTVSGVLVRQALLGLGVGGVAMLLFSKMNYKKWNKFAIPFFLLSFFLTAMVFEPHIGFSSGGATRWLNLGLFFFQPSELLKFGFVVYLASWINSHKKDIRSFKFGFLPFLLLVGFVAGLLILEPDLGTLGVIAVTSGLMYLIGGGRFRHIVMMIVLGAGFLAIMAFAKPYAMSRIMVFIDPSTDPQGIGYQLRQSLITVGSGGIFGRGMGMGVQKFSYLPEPMGDSIFAVFAEEFGFVGSLFLVGLFILFLYRGFLIASRAPDHFGRLLVSGIIMLVVIQSFINISAMIGILPLTGIPLIFVSKGGSALAITLAEIGVVLNVSKYT